MGAFFKWLGILILLGIVALLGLPLIPVAKDAVSAGAAKTYINEYGYGFDVNDEALVLDLPASVTEAQFIMMGEMHGFADTQKLDLMMVKRLADQLGMRIYIGEMSPAQAIAFNAMVLDGDDTMAREVFDYWGRE
ncbi:MAG: hypothetical protein AAF830_17480, partial [Pseudomonadota bacterium]